MIRQAVIADKDRVVELLRDSRVGAGFDREGGQTGFVFPFDPLYAERLFLRYLRGGIRCLCLVHDVGGTAQGILMAHAFEHDFGPVWMAQERVWWIDPGHRGPAALKMLTAYESWARAGGYRFVGMAGMGSDPAVGTMYERCGYRAAETHYLKGVA
jgi:hypothetical protein